MQGGIWRLESTNKREESELISEAQTLKADGKKAGFRKRPESVAFLAREGGRICTAWPRGPLKGAENADTVEKGDVSAKSWGMRGTRKMRTKSAHCRQFRSHLVDLWEVA